MDFDAFKEYVVENILDYLPSEYAGSEVSVQSVLKNNLSLDGLTIRKPGSNISPTIYLNSYYDELQEGRSMDSILDSIADVRVKNEVKVPFDVASVTEYDSVKEKIGCRLVGIEHNSDMLENRPHTVIGDDLAVIYHIELGEDPGGKGTMSIPISNSYLESLNITVENLDFLAKKNMSSLSPASFRGMSEVIAEIMGMSVEDIAMKGMPTDPSEEQMFVLSNENKFNGASCLLDGEIMDSIQERVGDFFILPSSIHEVLIVPRSSGCDLAGLEAMVREVNETQVAPEEQLSDHVYAYDAKAKQIYRADHEDEYKEQRAKIEEDNRNGHRGSGL